MPDIFYRHCGFLGENASRYGYAICALEKFEVEVTRLFILLSNTYAKISLQERTAVNILVDVIE